MKRKIFLLTLICLLIALPVSAGVITYTLYPASYSILVEGSQLNSNLPIMNYKGSTYVPLRAVLDMTDSKTVWDGKKVNITQELKRPDINYPEVGQVINEALDLLEEKDSASYNLILENVESIEKYEYDTKSYAFGGYGTIRITQTFVNDEKRLVPEYMAGALVHEAVHNSQDLNGNRERYEREAFAHQKMALELLGAPQWMINEATYK